jgi:hypothetical protein
LGIVNMTDIDFHIQTLAVTPRMFLDEFFNTLDMAASTLCAEYFNEGLLTLAVSLNSLLGLKFRHGIPKRVQICRIFGVV